MVGLGTALLGYELKAQQWLGFVVITVGCLFVPLARFSELRLKAYLNLGVLWALVAAIGTTGYSIVDKEALLYLNQTASDVLDDQYSAVFYLARSFGRCFSRWSSGYTSLVIARSLVMQQPLLGLRHWLG
ncbi:metabolite transporter (DMT) superfamily [Vibrio astriarenae]|nr:metabolite transporter (DMT) superfamily [Vibrio sp. C7]